MNAAARSINDASPRARRAALFVSSLAIAAAAVMGAAVPAFADGAPGYGKETVLCNANTHRVRVTTESRGVEGAIVGSDLFPHYDTYRVWLRIWTYANGAWTNHQWHEVTDGVHSVVFSAPAGRTSYWYFDWAFELASGQIYKDGEWAGDAGTHGIYSDQRGYTTLASCRT